MRRRKIRESFHNKTILLVEDDRLVRKTTERMLATMGFEVISAGNGVEALEKMTRVSAPVDLLISDVQMPNVSGPKLAASLRTRWPKLAVLFVSGNPVDDIATSGGDFLFIRKPFMMAELEETLETFFRPRL